MSAVPIRKVVITEFGGVDVLKVVDSTCPAPASDELQITTIYSGFAGGDIGMRKGVYPEQKPAPLTPGYSLTGTVRALGSGVSGFKVGETVAVLTRYDSEAEVVNQPAKHCIPVPDGLDLQQVTALLCDWATAYAMVNHTAKVEAGQRVFAHGLSGAVGSGIMTLSKLKGAEVYGTASARNHDSVKAQGAIPFEYSNKDWMQAMQKVGGADAVFDSLGYESFEESYQILSPKGILVAFGNNKDSLDDSEKACRDNTEAIMKLFERNDAEGKRTTFFGLSRDNPGYVDDVKALMALIQDGTIKVPIKKVWDMEDIKTAHREWGSGNGIGCLLIKVGKK